MVQNSALSRQSTPVFDKIDEAQIWIPEHEINRIYRAKKIKFRKRMEATASEGHERCTPIEYNFVDNHFYFFSEGGLKFRGCKKNKHVGMAIYEPYNGFGNLKSLQIEGMANLVEPFSEEYLKVMEYKKIPETSMRNLPQPMALIKVVPEFFDYLDSDLKKEEFGSRQHYDV